MAPDKGRRALLTLLLLHSSVAAAVDPATDDLFHPLRLKEDVQPLADDQLIPHRQPAQRRSHRGQISKDESHAPTLERLYVKGDLGDLIKLPHDKYVSDRAKSDLDNSNFEDKKKYMMKKNNPIDARGDDGAKNNHKYLDAKGERIFLKDQGAKIKDLLPSAMGAMSESTVLHDDDPPLLKRVGDMFKNGGWAIAKSTILRTINTIHHEDESSLLENVKQLLDIGDKMYFVQSLVGKLEPSLSDFLFDHIRGPMIYLTDILKYIGIFSNNIDSWNNVERLFASKMVKVLITKAQNIMKNNLSLDDLKKYYTLLQENNPMAAEALDFVLNLFPETSREQMGRSYYTEDMNDSYERVGTKVDRHDDHYGGYGSHDSGYGHGMSYQKVDPYLLLAGLGAATLLAYIAYLVLTTTPAVVPRKKKRSLDFPGDQDLSDLPEVLYSVNNMIETAEEKYGQEEDPMDDLSSSLNSLWSTRQKEGCVRCALQDRVKGGLDQLSLHHLLMSGAAQLMGAASVGPLLDELMAPVPPAKVGPLLDELMAPIPHHLGDKTQDAILEGPHDESGPGV